MGRLRRGRAQAHAPAPRREHAGRRRRAAAVTLTRVWRSADGAGLTVTLLDSPAGLRLHGEADILSVGALREAIEALPAGAREIRLELAGLCFTDVCSARELAALARRPARPRLILHEPPRSLIRLLRLLWPDCDQASAGTRTGNGVTASTGAARV